MTVPAATCESCRQLFEQNEDNSEFADLLERTCPNCACEKFSVGQGSPGPVDNSELLHRIIVSPRDYDPDTKSVRERPFHKLFGNGLSVCRQIATDDEVSRLAVEGLTHSTSEEYRQIFAICEVKTEEVRQMADANGGRIFGVYDQTVTALEAGAAPVPTHAGIFQRLPVPGTADGKRIRRDFAGELRKKFIAGTLVLTDLRNGLFVALNDRAKRGEFASD